MGCAASKSNDEEDDVVSLCRERKRLIKSAVESRIALAEAHCKYNQSLYAVALAIKLFVARHSSETSPFLITFPQSSVPVTETHFSNPIYKSIASKSPVITVSSSQSPNLEREKNLDREENEEDDDEETRVCEHFYDDVDPQVQSSQIDSGWDFFNPFFDGSRLKAEMVNGFGQNSDEDLRAVREAEGIPELEDDDEEREGFRERNTVVADGGGEGNVGAVRAVGDANVSQGEQKGVKLIDTPKKGRELLEALKDVEDHFVRAYESGVDVSKMLETNMVHLQSALEEIKESSNKLIQSVTWRRSTLSRSSSCKSFLASSSKSSSTWTEFKNDLFYEYQGMESGSHSLTLGRLYAWEKKLYEEVKAGEQTRKLYERKCLHLRNRDSGGEGIDSLDKTGAEVRDLHSRILVTIRSAESIAFRIQRLRDDELQPQLIELLHGLMRTWKIMLDTHETQNRTMCEVRSLTRPSYGKFSNDSHRLATLQLEAELQNWRVCFAGYVSSLKAYVEALNGWLSKFITPEFDGPPLLFICRDWFASLEKLPDKSVTYTMKIFGKDVRALWAQQGEEQKQKRKVDGLAKELERRVLEFQRDEGKILEGKLSEKKTEIDVRNRIEYMGERKYALDMFRKKIELEKVKHCDSMKETERTTLDGLQTGFSSVFGSLIEFSKASVKMYGDIVTYIENARMGVENGDHLSSMEGMGSQVEAKTKWKMGN